MQNLQFTSVITQFICTKVGCHSKINVVPNTADEAVQMWFSHIQTWWRLCWLNNFRYARSLNFMSVLWWGPVLSAHGGIQILSDRAESFGEFFRKIIWWNLNFYKMNPPGFCSESWGLETHGEAIAIEAMSMWAEMMAWRSGKETHIQGGRWINVGNSSILMLTEMTVRVSNCLRK